ncbi:MAG TPA: hypothetical protein GX700_07675 [Paracoccus sp.]|nr:hypothetical protein [Paracoccus sp. (in: a-proteobacteria)]
MGDLGRVSAPEGDRVKQEDDNAIYALARILGRVLRASEVKLRDALKAVVEGGAEMDARFLIISMFDDAIAVASHLKLPDHRAASQIEMLNSYKDKFILNCSQGTTQDFAKAMGDKRTISDIDMAGDVIAGSNIDMVRPVDLSILRQDTKELIEKLFHAKLPEIQRKALILKLSAFNRLLTECRGMSDDALRRRIKCIYADFCAEFESFDKEYRGALEIMTAWAKKTMKPGVLALALCADVSTVAGYITDNGPKLAITDQSD